MKRLTKPRAVNFADVLVPVPVPVRTTPIVSTDEGRPFVGMYVEALHKWFVDRTLADVVAAYLQECDHGNGGFGYGASEIGSYFPLYFMGTGTTNKRQVGTVAYNGNVKLSVVLS